VSGIAKQRARRRTLDLPGRLWSLLLDALVGYGYRSWLAGVWLLAWWLVGTLVFAAAYPRHLALAKPGVRHAAFQPAVYALDVLLPVVDLDQQATWIPKARHDGSRGQRSSPAGCLPPPSWQPSADSSSATDVAPCG
jgi:hypothetical protein